MGTLTANATNTETTTMKALVQEGAGSADVLHLRDVPRPTPTQGRVLVRVRAASVNALDWHTVHGGLVLDIISKLMRTKDIPIRGVDLAGVVEAVGPGVTRFAPGDEVLGGAPASFAEYASSREDNLVLKPANVSFEQGSTVGVAGRTALQGLRDVAKVTAGQRVLVCGAGGGVGTYAVQVAKALGAHVTAVTSARNMDVIAALGPDELIDYSKGDFTRRGAKYDVIYDVAGHRSIGSLRRMLAPGGILVLAGAGKRGGFLGIIGRIGAGLVRSRIFRQRIVFYMAQTRHDDLELLKDMIAAGTIRPVIDRQYPLSEAAEAVRYVGTGQARGKVVINVG